MPVDTECDSEAGRPDASCGFPLGIRGILDFAPLLQCFAVPDLGPRSRVCTNPGAQKRYVDFFQRFRDQTVALLNLPPLTEFEKFLRSRFRGTGVGASTFLQAGLALVPPGFFGSTRLRLAEYANLP